MAGLLSGASLTMTSCSSADKPGVESPAATGKHACKGMNACKGQGGCKTTENDCSGKNGCKGKGGCATNKE